MKKTHFGVTLPQIKRPWIATKEAAANFEAMGYDSLWVCDHLYGPQSKQLPILEAWSTLAAVAAITERVELGTLVTPAGMRNPAQLAKTIASIDNIAGGRVIAGLGAGWMQSEFEDFGVPFLDVPARLKQLEETIDLCVSVWKDSEPVTIQGEYVNVTDLMCEPPPPRRVPILIGGAGEKVTLKLVAEKADMWNNLAGHQDNLPHKVSVLRSHCDDIDRNFDDITISQQCLVTIAKSAGRSGSDGRHGPKDLWRPHGQSQRRASDYWYCRTMLREDSKTH